MIETPLPEPPQPASLHWHVLAPLDAAPAPSPEASSPVQGPSELPAGFPDLYSIYREEGFNDDTTKDDTTNGGNRRHMLSSNSRKHAHV
ncbi:hypothetical protein WJX74_009365 [Apatococcus lobatus]|uniref:Uncharacterized protein n=1 Tax=Apatococcus lobatus TaxID=904363 RepID=A0AAW1R1V9_9CHLO